MDADKVQLKHRGLYENLCHGCHLGGGCPSKKAKESLTSGPVILGNGSSAVVRHLLGQSVLITTFGVEVIVVKKVLASRKRKCPIIGSRREASMENNSSRNRCTNITCTTRSYKDKEDDDMLASN